MTNPNPAQTRPDPNAGNPAGQIPPADQPGDAQEPPYDPNADQSADPGDIEAELAQSDTEWAGVPAETPTGGGAADLPDGKYVAYVENAEVKRAKSSGEPMLSWMLRVNGGAHDRAVIFRQNMLDRASLMDPKKKGYLLRDLNMCGVAINKPSDIAARVRDLVGLVLEIQLKTTVKKDRNGQGKSYQNCYVNACRGVKNVAQAGGQAGAQPGQAGAAGGQGRQPAAAPQGKKPNF